MMKGLLMLMNPNFDCGLGELCATMFHEHRASLLIFAALIEFAKLYAYIAFLLILTIVAFVWSLESKRVNFRIFWKPLGIAILVYYPLIVVWDHLFTVLEVWTYNKHYTLHYQIWELPVEQYMYYLGMPYVYLLIYEILNKLVKSNLNKFALYLSILLIFLFVMILWYKYEKLYTASAAVICMYLLINHLLVFRTHRRYLGKLYMTFFVTLIPFLILSGLQVSLPSISYHAESITGITFFRVPVENLMMHFASLLIISTVYEFQKKRWNLQSIFEVPDMEVSED